MTGLVLSLAVAVAQFSPDWMRIVIVLGIFLVGQFLERLHPRSETRRDSVGLHPVWLMFALFAFGYLFGFVGLLVAVRWRRRSACSALFAAAISREPHLYRRKVRLTVMSVASAPRQLALALEHAESFAREDFLCGPSNAAALALVEGWPDWPGRCVVLVGPEGSGKSHLAAIWAADAGARFLAARSLGEANLPAALVTGALVVEDLAAQAFDERALFHLINLAGEEGAFLLLTARTAPAAWIF